VGEVTSAGWLLDSLLIQDSEWFAVEEPSSVGRVRRAAADVGRALGYSEGRIGELEIVVTETGSNLVKHARQGQMLLRLAHREDGTGTLELVATDAGPGMREVDASRVDGTSTTGTLGIGLGAITRLSTSFDIHSVPGRGTVLVARLGPGGRALPPPPPTAAGITRAMTGEEVCGDGWAARRRDGRTLVLLCDGLGHGPLAARATEEALRAFRDAPEEAPGAVLRRLHQAINHTRGAAGVVALLDPDAGQLRYAGIGNIAGTLLHPDGRQGLISQPGIVGSQVRNLREITYPLPAGAVLVLHSDGVNDRWSLDGSPELLRHDPLVLAATLLRDAGVRRDDASVLVARAS
jgi:anti-sigma regulatory factor (Ser/Thr protein kinase)